MVIIEFLIDENLLGIDRYVDTLEIKFRKVGDQNCPPLGSDDATVAKFAQKEKLVVVTNDDKLKKQCELFEVKCIFMDLRDIARKIKEYVDSC